MRRIIFGFLVCIAMVSSNTRIATSADDSAGTAIALVIERQISAFQKNDLQRAFSYASPTIQKKFGTPEVFGKMVEMGYPMVWRPSRWQMVKLVDTSHGLVQVVLFVDESGREYEAGYLMQQIDGRWRVNGVHVRRRPSVGA